MINAFCHSCGHVFPSVFNMFGDGGGTMQVERSMETCPVCGGPAETQNSVSNQGVTRPTGRNTPVATLAFAEFQRSTVQSLRGVNISRLQAHRFQVAAEKGADAAERIGKKIGPEFQKALSDAKRTDDPSRAIKWLKTLAKFIAYAGAGVFATLAGFNEGIDLIERLNGGQPFREIIEGLRDQPQVDEGPYKAEAKKDEPNQEQPPDESGGGVDVR